MATYKVIQDIEAEDKFVGPLTLRQFIFAAIAVSASYASFYAMTKGIWLVLLLLAPIILFCGFFAWPFGREQPTEVWALAKLRFLIKPRKRIWDQSGMKQLVTITAPKHLEQNLTDGLSQVEVKSRLSALAGTLDSRGWAVKNVNINFFSQPSLLDDEVSSDRLIAASSLPQEVPPSDVLASDDMLDENHNPTAQQLNAMISQSEQAHRQALIATVQGNPATVAPATQQSPADYWFMQQPGQTPGGKSGYNSFGYGKVVAPGMDATVAGVGNDATVPTAAEQAVLDKVRSEQERSIPTYLHMHKLVPGTENAKLKAKNDKKKAEISDQKANGKAVTPKPNPDILRLANNDDLNVATLAREAQKATPQSSDGEVVISLR